MKRSLFILILSICILAVNAQSTAEKSPCFRVSSFSASFGFPGALTSNTMDDYYKLKDAVEDPSLFIDITGYSNGYEHWSSNGMEMRPGGIAYSGPFSGGMAANLGLTPYSKKLGKYNEKRELRITLGIDAGVRNTFHYYNINNFPIDTFQSANSNALVIADSGIFREYYYDLQFTEVNLGLSYLFKTDVNRRFHFYTGGGFLYGITLKSSVTVSDYADRSVYYYNQFDKPTLDEEFYDWHMNKYGYSENFQETKLSKPMQFVRVFVPFGISLRLSKKPQSFFNNANLYWEFNPGVEFQIIGSGTSYVNPYFGFAFIGFNYHW